MSEALLDSVAGLIPCSSLPFSELINGTPGVTPGAVSIVSGIIPGISGCAARFDGGYVNFSASPATQFDNRDFSIDFWCRMDLAQGEWPYVVSSGYDNQWVLIASHPDGPGKFCFFAPGYSGPLLISTSSAATGKLTHVEIDRSGSNWLLFINGSLEAQGLFSGAMPSVSGLMIGGTDFRGEIERVRTTIGAARHTANFVPDPAWFDGESDPVRVIADVGLSRAIGWQPDGAASVKQMAVGARSRDIDYGGKGRIVSTVERVGAMPIVRRVRLFRDRDGVCVGETWSNAAGAYAFTNIDPAELYSVVAYDHEHNYRAVIADNLTPELMP